MNYYLLEQICNCCGHSKKTMHLGKSSGGWTFSFQGTNAYQHPQVRSYKDLLTILESAMSSPPANPNQEWADIRDEEGRILSLEEFKDLVESKRKEKLNHTVYCRIHHPDHAARECWLDEEGNSFSSGDFS